MIMIGITGGTGAGKTTVLGVLEEMGALTVDCDDVYHELLRESGDMLFELENRFPGVVENGVLNRRALGNIVFSDKAALGELNEITHKYVSREVSRRVSLWEEKGGEISAVDAIALIEGGLGERCDFTIGVTAPKEVRAKRIMEREGIPYEYAIKRIEAQQPDSFYEAGCDYVLVNDCATADEFRIKCGEFLKNIMEERRNGKS